MLRIRHLALITGLAIATPAIASAQAMPRWSAPRSTAYDEGYSRGRVSGAEDYRRGKHFDFTDESAYKKADLGYDSRMGKHDVYRDDFRRGFAEGYAAGFGPRDLRSSDVVMLPAVSDDDALARPVTAMDLALATGYNDGYREGLNDGRAGHRDDPTGESRYHDGDHGYASSYGPKDFYRLRYRDAFIQGYERGFNEGR
jgi:hypothetical protein